METLYAYLAGIIDILMAIFHRPQGQVPRPKDPRVYRLALVGRPNIRRRATRYQYGSTVWRRGR
jgi:hypothetical protein